MVGFVKPESLRKDEWPQLTPDPGSLGAELGNTRDSGKDLRTALWGERGMFR